MNPIRSSKILDEILYTKIVVPTGIELRNHAELAYSVNDAFLSRLIPHSSQKIDCMGLDLRTKTKLDCIGRTGLIRKRVFNSNLFSKKSRK